ncbi:BrnT family toxin [Methylobacterium sp. sgz302541]|uniref:BrnT family toxin n=1 Tax=unclassified Methylobacterium TaxID=2615210 RepID=UPI003D33737D
MLVVWDEPKRISNLRTHGLDFADARERFSFEEAIVFPSYAGRGGRERYVAVGPLDDRLVAFVFAILGTEAVSLISLRPASRRERRLYEQA